MVPVPETMENNSEKNSTKAEKRKIETDASPSEAKKANINNSAEIFNSTRFKFLLRNQETVRYALETFVEYASVYPNAPDNVDIVSEFCELSSDGNEILTLLSAQRLQPSIIAGIFNVLQYILIRVVDDLVVYKKLAHNITQKLLTTHLETIYRMLKISQKSKPVKITLKLLTAIVILSENSARNVLNKFDFDISGLMNSLLERRNVMDDQDIRACCLHFFMSFLMTGSDTIIHDFLCKRNLMAKIFAGMRVDKFSVIELVVPLLLDKVVKNEHITKSEKVKIFSSEVLSHLARVYNWLGPKDWKKFHKKIVEFQEIEETPALVMVRKTVHQLLLELCTSPKNGIIFFDKTFGTSGRDQNRIIRLFLQDIHVMPFFEDTYLKDLIVKIFQACPEQMQPFLMQVQKSTTPRASLKWLQCMDFLEKILEIVPDIPPPLKTSKKIPVEKLLELVQSVVLPPQDILQSIIVSVGHKELCIRHRCLQYVLRMMKKLGAIIQYCTNGTFLSDSKIFTKADVENFSGLFKDHMTRVLPTVKTIFDSWQEMNKELSQKHAHDSVKLGDMPEVNSLEHVILIEQTLCLYQTFWPEAFSDFPFTGEVFDQVQKLCKTWKQCQTGDELVLKKVNEESYQQTRVRLYLLKLFADTDARKIPWNKKNEDGQPLLYFLLDMLLAITNDDRLLSIIKQLICQLLYHSGLFHQLEMELHLWMDWLIKCGLDESLGRNEELLQFVATVFTNYICNPHPYIEKIFEVSSEASVIEMGSYNNADLVSTTSIDDFIERINEFDDQELGLNEHPIEESENSSLIKLPFSPLIIVAIKETAQKSHSELKPLKNYLRSVLIDLFHSQTNPIPLCILVTEERKSAEEHSWISKRIVSYIKSWLPDSKVSQKEKTIDVEKYKDECSSVLLKTFHQNGKNLVNNSEFVTLLFESVNQLNMSETLRAAQQCLCYIQTQLSRVDVSKNQDLSALQLTFKYLKKTVKHLFRKCQPPTESNVPLDQVSEDFQILQTETFANDRMLSEFLNFLSQQSAIQHWFLAVKSGLAKSSTPGQDEMFRLLRNLVTKELTSCFSEFPRTSGKGHLGSYCTKIKVYLEECLLLASKGHTADMSLALMVLKQLLPYIDFATIQKSIELLLQLHPEVLLSEMKTSKAGHMLVNFLSYMIRNCKTFLLEADSLNSIYSLLLHSESSSKLLTVAKSLFEAKPYYCLSCPSNLFVHLLTSASSEHLNLARILMENSVALDQVFVHWILDRDDLKQNMENFLNICITWCKCQRALPTNKSKKCLSKISKAARKYLCAYISESDIRSSDNSPSLQEDYLQLLHQFARLHAPGYKHMPSLSSFKELVDSDQTISLKKLQIFLALTQWAESVKDQSVDPAVCRIDVCMKSFLNSVQARVGTPEDKEFELQLLTYLEQYLIDMPPEYNDLLLSSWTSFIRSALRLYFSDSRVLRLVSHLIPRIYTESNSETISPSLKDLHEMLISHSGFLPVIMGSESAESKELLVDILLTVIERQPECCAEGHLYVLMGVYGASLSTCDQKLLKMVYLYEKNGINLTKLRPYLWGVKVIEMYELSKQETSLNRLPSTDRIFEIIDTDKMMKSILHFPVKRKLTPLEVAPAEQWKSLESCYDPCFLLPLLAHLVAPYNNIRTLNFMMKNCLGYSFAALSSHDSNMRAAGYHILIQLEEQLKLSSFHRKDQYLYLLHFLQNSITDENTKLPFVIAIYMMKVSQILLNEGNQLYASITAPLMVKPCLELNLIPEFFRLFNSSNLHHYHERMWMLYLLHDGLRESHDYHIYKKYYIFKIIMSFANSVLCNYTSQFQILRILKRACQQKTGAYDLARHCGLVSWINNFISHVDPHSQAIVLLTEIVHTLWFSLLKKNVAEEGLVTNNSFELPLPFVQEMQVLLLNLLQSYREGNSYAAMKFFLPLFASVLLLKKQASLKEKTSDKLFPLKCEEGVKDNPSEVTDESVIKAEPDPPIMSHIKMELTPRDVLLVLYQSRLHSSNVHTGERSLNLMKRWGYACNHLTEVSHSLQKQTADKSDSSENVQSEFPDLCQEEETCSKNEQKKLQQALIDICLSWIPSNTFLKENDSCFDETLELVMTCLCEEASNTISLSSILNILHWIQNQLNHWNTAIAVITQNTSQDNQPVLFMRLLSLYARLVNPSYTERNASDIGTSCSVNQPHVDALHELSNICRTLSEKYSSFKGSCTSKPNTSHISQPFIKVIAEFQT